MVNCELKTEVKPSNFFSSPEEVRHCGDYEQGKPRLSLLTADEHHAPPQSLVLPITLKKARSDACTGLVAEAKWGKGASRTDFLTPSRFRPL
jgi:hypothetical protein